jgi:hypothetical protein
MKASARRRYKEQVSGMAGYVGNVSGHDGKEERDGKTREETDTRGLYPSMPETWNVAESKPERQVSGMAGYVGDVSGHDGQAVSHRREKTGKDGRK